MQKRKLKERNLNLSVWLDREKRLTFVETAGVSFGLPVIPIIVKQKDARVEAHIRKGKKKKEISASSQKILLWTLWWWGPLTFEWKRHEVCFGWIPIFGRKERDSWFYKATFFQPYVVKPPVSEFRFVGKKHSTFLVRKWDSLFSRLNMGIFF